MATAQHILFKFWADATRYNPRMRRLLLVLLMLVVPVQYGWSMTQRMQNHHSGNDASIYTFHTHGGDEHEDEDHAPLDATLAHDANVDGDHDGHYHPVFSTLIPHAVPSFGTNAVQGAPPTFPDTFTSNIPPLLDWPPSALARAR